MKSQVKCVCKNCCRVFKSVIRGHNQGGWWLEPPIQKPSPPWAPKWTRTLYTSVWEVARLIPSKISEPPDAPHVWKTGYALLWKYKTSSLLPKIVSNLMSFSSWGCTFDALCVCVIVWGNTVTDSAVCDSVLTGGNWQKWKRVFLTCPCHEIYRDEAVGLKSCKNTWKITIFVKMWNLGQYRENLIFSQ